MSRFHSFMAAAMLVGLAAVPDGTKAASITETFVFTGTFAAGPFDTVSGRATVSFDPALSQTVTPVASFSSTLPASYGSFSFTYNASVGSMFIGDNCLGNTCFVQSRTDQAFVAFRVNDAGLPDPSSASLVYSTASFSRSFSSRSAVVNLATGTAVPEPASLALIASGLLGLIFAVRRRA